MRISKNNKNSTNVNFISKSSLIQTIENFTRREINALKEGRNLKKRKVNKELSLLRNNILKLEKIK